MRAVQNAPGTHGGAGLPWPGESLGCWQEETPPDFEAWTECGEEEGKGSQMRKARESRAECARERGGWLCHKSAVGSGRHLELKWHHASGLQQVF